jgi:hypothetical protein
MRPERRVKGGTDFFGSCRRWVVGTAVLSLRLAFSRAEWYCCVAPNAEPVLLSDVLERKCADVRPECGCEIVDQRFRIHLGFS